MFKHLPHNLLASASALALATAVAAGAPAIAQDTKTDMKNTTRAEAGIVQPLQVMAASDLVGHEVLDKDYEPVGRLKYIVVRPDTGRIVYAMIGSMDMPGKLHALPWEAINKNVWTGISNTGITLNVSADMVKKSATWDISKLADLTQPTVSRDIYTYYGITEPEENKQAKAENDLLIGAMSISKIGKPLVATENQLRGVPVQTKLGGDLGAIDELVVDLKNGRIAYALLARGGYLGMGEEWLAVPLQALNWSGYQARVDFEADDLENIEGLDKSAGVPTWVRTKDMRELYKDFDVQPYWKS